MGVCGSCGMMVNGTPKLTCAAFLKDYYPGPVRVEPLANFPVERDLIVNITDFVKKLKDVKPFIIRKEEKPVSEGEYLQSPAELANYKQFSIDAREAYDAAIADASSGSACSTGSSRKSRTSRTEITNKVDAMTQTTPIQRDVDMPMTLATGPAIAYPAGRNTIAPIQL